MAPAGGAPALRIQWGGKSMNGSRGVDRGQLLGAAAVGAASALAFPAQGAVSGSVANLPARGNALIRNAYVITMVPGAPDLPEGDVLVENGAIADVGTSLSAPGA